MLRLFVLFVILAMLMSGCANPLVTPSPRGLPTEAPVQPRSGPTDEPQPTSAPQPADEAVVTDAAVTQLLTLLKERGVSFDLEGASLAELLRPAPGAAYTGPSGYLFLHPFSDNQAAALQASQVTAKLADRSVIIDWIAPPHFYQYGSVIALYLGEDAATLAVLTDLCGAQFAPAN